MNTIQCQPYTKAECTLASLHPPAMSCSSCVAVDETSVGGAVRCGCRGGAGAGRKEGSGSGKRNEKHTHTHHTHAHHSTHVDGIKMTSG